MNPPRIIIAAGVAALLSVALVPCLRAQQTVPSVPVKPSAITSSTSASGQFVVYGTDLTTRGAFCMLADETAAALGRLLRDNARYTLPVIVVVNSGPDVSRTEPAVSWNISQLAHGGFHLQANVLLRGDFRSDDFSRELVRLLIAERILRNHRELKTTRQVLPDWILTGVTQALEFRSRSKPSAIFAAVFKSGQIYSVDKIIGANAAQLDALTRGIYETSACALVLALLDQPDGPARFGKFLNALATENKPDRDLLRQSFPTLGVSKNSLEKWWTLQMAALATPTPLETLGVTETEERLDDALTLVFGPEKKQEKKAAPKSESAKGSTKEKKTSWLPHAAGDYVGRIWASVVDCSLPFLGGQQVGFLGFGKKKDADEDTDEPKAKDKAAKDKAAKAAADKKAKDAEQKKAADLQKAKTAAQKKADDEKKSKDAAQRKADDDRKAWEAAQKKADEERKTWEAAQKKADDEKKKVGTKPPEKPAKLDTNGHRAGQRPEELAKSKTEPGKKDAPDDKRSGEEEKKGSMWNPLSWFHRRDKPLEQPAGEKSQSKPRRKTDSGDAVADTGPSSPPKRNIERPTGPPIEEYAVVMKRSDRALILNRNLQQLSALKLQAHPLYRPLIAEYEDAARLIANGKDKGMSAKLADLKARRAKVSEQARAVESYVDWYEASETRTYSGAFDDYLKLRDRLDKEIRSRSDALSKYLDAVEKEYE